MVFTSVVELWKEQVEGSAPLWVDISAGDGAAYVRRALERSKASMIKLDYPALIPADDLDLESFMTEAAPHIARPSTLQLLEILRNSPDLVTLCLRSIRGLVGIGSQVPTIPVIELPKLSSLTLEWIDNQAVNWILSTIRIQNCRNVQICAEIGGVNVRSLLTPSIAHLLHPSIVTPDPRFSDIKVEVEGRDGFRIQARGMDLELYVDGEDQIEGIWGWLVQGLRSEAPAYPVQLVLDFSDMDPSSLDFPELVQVALAVSSRCNISAVRVNF
ncbi:hypothetical protein FRC00_011018 [Tulasnella sp. 408]|nr:hypothetical protein FRC00_011018 [Tulasnella sp. 408]